MQFREEFISIIIRAWDGSMIEYEALLVPGSNWRAEIHSSKGNDSNNL